MATWTIKVLGAVQAGEGYQVQLQDESGLIQGPFFPNRQAFLDWLASVPAPTFDDKLKFIIQLWRDKDPTLTPANMVGKTITYDSAQAINVVKLT